MIQNGQKSDQNPLKTFLNWQTSYLRVGKSTTLNLILKSVYTLRYWITLKGTQHDQDSLIKIFFPLYLLTAEPVRLSSWRHMTSSDVIRRHLTSDDAKFYFWQFLFFFYEIISQKISLQFFSILYYKFRRKL